MKAAGPAADRLHLFEEDLYRIKINLMYAIQKEGKDDHEGKEGT